MSAISLKGIDKYYGRNHVLKSLDLEIRDGEFMTLLGPSGCGKTTLLRILAGLEKPQNGVVLIDGREVVNAEDQFFETPDKRGLNLVFQSYALWPHMTVFDNVAFSMTLKKAKKDEIKKSVESALSRMRIAEFAERYPSELSGGQQQRVAIARAIVNNPRILLLDEPLSNLDAKLRVEMRTELKRLHHELGTTIVYVTHDQVEALTMSSRIAVFFDGILEQVDTPMALYNNPASLRVADFIGNPRINFIDAEASCSGGGITVKSPFGEISAALDEGAAFGGGKMVMGLRPEKIRVSKKSMEGWYEGRVESCQMAGSETILALSCNGVELMAVLLGLKHFAEGGTVWFRFDSDEVNIYDGESGKLVKSAREEED